MYRNFDLNKIVLIAFLIICIFSPGDPLHLKILFFLLTCILNLGIFKYSIQSIRYTYLFIMGAVFPLSVMVWSSLVGGKILRSISEIYPATLILLVPIIVEKGIDYENIVMKLLKLMAFCTIIIVLLDIVGMLDVNGGNVLRNLFYQYDMGLMGKSPDYAAYYKIFFKASPLLLLLLPYCFEKHNYIMAVITLIALILSGTRANIFVAVFVFSIGIFDIWNHQDVNILVRLSSRILLVLGIIIILPSAIHIIQKMMETSGSVSSDAIRSGQFNSFIYKFKNPLNLILGDGFGTNFWDGGRNAFVQSSEIAYFDLLRKIGLIWFVPFMIFVLRPIGIKVNLCYKVAYIGYLASCFTNPLLFSSTAYILYILFYTWKYKDEYIKDNMTKYSN